jgi:hypothetical protein
MRIPADLLWWGGVLTHLKLLLAARGRAAAAGRRKPVSSPAWTGHRLSEIRYGAAHAHANQLLGPLYQAQFYSTMRLFLV